MFKFIKDIKALKEKVKDSHETLSNLEKIAIKNNNSISGLEKNTGTHFKKQDIKIDEILDTLIDLQDINKLQEENEILVDTVMVMLESIHLINNYLKNETIDKVQLNKQMEILEAKINDQLIKSKITLISNKGEGFSAKKHEVVDVFKIEENSKKHGEIKTTVESGYMYKGKVIKKAKVEAYSRQ